ncbi:putative vesicular transport factor Uso1p, partial [Reticulomyxa filosa]
FELTAKSTTDDGHHVKKLNELLERLKDKYEKRIANTKQHYTEKMNATNVTVAKLNNVRVKLSEEIEQLMVQLKQKEGELDEKEKKRQELEQELDQLKKMWTQKEASAREKYEQIHTQLKQDIESMKTNLSTFENDKKELENKLEQSTARVTELTTERDNLHNQLQLAKDELSTHGKQRNDIEEQLNDVMEQLENTKQENKKLHSMNQELTEKQAKMIKDCQTRMENALQQKMSVDVELKELQRLHDTKVNGMDSQLEETLKKYQQLVKANELLKGYQAQNQDLVRQLEQMQKQLDESKNEQLKLRDKAQLHYSRRKEKWKELKQLQQSVKEKDAQLRALNQKLKDTSAREVQNAEKLSKQYETVKRDLVNVQKTLSSNDTSIEKLMKALDEAVGRLKEKLELKDLETSGVFEFTSASFANEHVQPTYSSANVPSYLRQLIAQIASVTNRGDILRQQCHKYEEKHRQLNQVSMKNTHQLEHLAKENSDLRTEIADLKLQLTNKSKHLESFKKKQEELEMDFENYDQKLNLARQQVTQADKLLDGGKASPLSWKRPQTDKDNAVSIEKPEQENQRLMDSLSNRRPLEQYNQNVENDLHKQLRSVQDERETLTRDMVNILFLHFVYSEKLAFVCYANTSFLYSQSLSREKEQLQMEVQQQTTRVSQLESERNIFSTKLISQSDQKENNHILTLEETVKNKQAEIEKITAKAQKLRSQRDFAKNKYKELKTKFNQINQRFSKPSEQKTTSASSSRVANENILVSPAVSMPSFQTNNSVPILNNPSKNFGQKGASDEE